MTTFLALPWKQVPRAQTIFVAQAGRKIRIFSLTLQRYKIFIAFPNYSSKKARKKTRSKFLVSQMRTAHSAQFSHEHHRIGQINIYYIYNIYIIYIVI